MMRLGLVIEGGGMKCAYTAGILDRMLDDKIRPDYVIGVSAGAACGASFVAGQRGRNRRFFVDYVTDPDYMGLTAYRSSGEFFNLKYIYQDMTGKDGKDPLDYDAIMKNPAQLWAVATDAETGKPRYFSKNDFSPTDYSVYMATCAIPVACRPVRMGHRGLYHRLLNRYPALIHNLDIRHERYNAVLEASKRLEEHGHALILAPHEELPITTYTKDPRQLQGLYDTALSEYEMDREKLLDFISA